MKKRKLKMFVAKTKPVNYSEVKTAAIKHGDVFSVFEKHWTNN